MTTTHTHPEDHRRCEYRPDGTWWWRDTARVWEQCRREHTRYVMRVIGVAGSHYEDSGPQPLPNPCYLETYDAAYANGRGRAALTGDVRLAQTWPTAMAVIEAWRAPSPTMPTRPDGRPNRPLTTYTIIPEEVAT